MIFPHRNIHQNSQYVTHSLHFVPYSLWTALASQKKLSVMKKFNQPLSARQVFGRNLRLARHIKEMSQEELALRANLSRVYVSGVERGARNVSIDNMSILSMAVDVPLRDLVDPALFNSLDNLSA